MPSPHLPYEDIAKRFEGKRVLVTGAAGFVGNALARWLHMEGQARVWTIVRDIDPAAPYHRREFYTRYIDGCITGDITNEMVIERAVAESEPEIVFHLAAVSQVRHARIAPRENYRTNVMGTVNLLESLRLLAPDAAVVVASSDKAYGKVEPDIHGKSIIDNETALDPVHPYDTAKATADVIARSYALYYGQRIIITRCGNIYGPGDVNWQRLIPGVLRDLIQYRKPLIRSDGKHIRDYNYIDDIVLAYVLCAIGIMEPWAFGPVEISNGSSWLIANEMGTFSVLDVVDACRAAVPWGHEYPPLIMDTAKDETPVLRLDGSKFRETFGMPKSTKLLDGIEATVEWLTDYLIGGLDK
jgi:CDP-glucose 4,6-dehydratase